MVDESVSSSDDEGRIGENIRDARKRAGLSQGALAAAMRDAGEGHWHQTTVSRVENGRQPLSMGEYRSLETILGGDLFAGTELGTQFKKVAQVVMDSTIQRRLERTEQALEQATTALAELRELLEIQQEGEQRRGEHQEAP